MIPLRLSLENFMCYRDNVPPLELEGIHVACLCGDNGHGKTALLDAITWALWGQARAQTHEELIHQGRQTMSVELEFMARDQRYRVSRKYSRPVSSRQGVTILELQVASDAGFRPITGNMVRQTEERIRDILHMDFDTFVNTAFLRQGRADSFTTSKPAKRKEVLAEVLDLSYYQALEERSKQKSRQAQDRIRDVDSAIAMRQQELSRKPEREDRMASVAASLALVEPEVEAQRDRVEELRDAVDSLRGRGTELHALNRRLDAGRPEIADLMRQSSSHEARVAEHEAALRRESETRETFALLEEAKAEQEHLDKAAFRAGKLTQEKGRLSEAVAVQRERLSSQVAQRREMIDGDLRPKVGRIGEIEKALDALAVEEGGLAELEQELRKQSDEAQAISARTAYLDESMAGLKQGMEETRKKFDMLDQDDALCPLCRKPLGKDGQEHLRVEYEAQGKEAKRLFREQGEEHRGLKRRGDKLAAEISTREADLGGRRRDVQSRAATLERDLADGASARDDLRPALERLAELESDLEAKRYAMGEQASLARLEVELSALVYDGERHRQVQERVRELAPSSEDHRRLIEAQRALPVDREALETSRQMLRRRQQDVEQSERRRKELELELKSLPSLESGLSEARLSLERLDKQRQETVVEQRVLTEQLGRLTLLKLELEQLERSRRGLVDEKSIHDELAVAFGKNGVQALMIETAIPQLQNDANELLGRLTDNRMFVKLQLQPGRRERRMGLPSEELEIKISDEMGTRSYETFSSGEAFRISFALRIALSKLLARRSGAPLPVLFVDEGFGSQDTAGQERLKEAIQSIQSDFQKIIVITHIEQVKESFPTRIEVTKTPSGSTFVVV